MGNADAMPVVESRAVQVARRVGAILSREHQLFIYIIYIYHGKWVYNSI